MQTAISLVVFIEYYVMVGLVVAAIFLAFGIERVEPGARGAYAFRALLVPGLCILWPLVLVRWFLLERSGNAS